MRLNKKKISGLTDPEWKEKMLKYIINVSSNMLAVSIVIGVTFAFVDRYCRDIGRRIMRFMLLFGFAAAGVRTYITNTRRLVGGWKVGAYGFGISMALYALFLLVLLIVLLVHVFTRKAKENAKKWIDIVCNIFISVVTGLLTASYCYMVLPTIYHYPFEFDTGDNGILSSEYLLKLGGYLIAIIVCIFALVSAYKLSSVCIQKGYGVSVIAATILLNAIYEIYVFARLVLVLAPRKIINSIKLFT